MLQIQNISKEYGMDSILEGVSFEFAPGEKIALVGRNGSGKSTLLKIISGIMESDSGNIRISDNEKIAYLPQKIDDESLNKTVLEYIQQNSKIEKFEIEKILHELELVDGILNKPVEQISGGQKTKICLVGILLSDADYIILDEPTNNLDMKSLVWLENFIKNSKSGFLIVSHDRRFLDNVTSKVVELTDDKNINIERGNYSDYLKRIKEKRSRQQSEYQEQEEEISRLKQSAHNSRSKADIATGYETKDNDKMLRDHKREQAKHSASAAKQMEKRIDVMDKIEKPDKHNILKINIKESGNSGNNQISARDLIVGYEDFSAGVFNFDINPGDKVCFTGANGSGKTTLLKTILSQIDPIKGKIMVGSKVKFGNLTQEHDNLPDDLSMLEFITTNTEMPENEIFNALVKFNFTEKQIRDQIKKLSPGEKTRLILTMFTLKNINTLILDEPTNHLDIEALIAIEEAVENYKGTVILVSHDRYLTEQIKPDVIFNLHKDGIKRVLSL